MQPHKVTAMMKSPVIPFLAFLLILLLAVPDPFNYATSVVPGWHTTIYSALFIREMLIFFMLLFAVIGYWLFLKKAKRISWILFALHFLFTVPIAIFIRVPTLFINVKFEDPEKLFNAVDLIKSSTSVGWAIFIAGQVLFLFYYLRTIRENKDSVTEKA